MRTVILEVRSLRESLADFADAWTTGAGDGDRRISFATPELLWRVLGEKRWEILKEMSGAGPLAIREAARRVQRDVKAVHRDVHALLDAGILDRTADGRIEFPYDAIHVDFVLRAA